MICNAPNMELKYTIFKPEALAKRTGLAYIPLYSPSANSKSQSFTCDNSVTLQEKALSECLIPRESSIAEYSSSEEESPDGVFYRSSIPMQTATDISEFLKLPKHPSKKSTQHQKLVGTILTSIEFREKNGKT